ncbi:Cytochrome c oxidase subunit 6B [Ceratobasidium sp. 428]|nr:Cytochrome c oxidase subunit 6B [Ceratobasidium sp. 428]
MSSYQNYVDYYKCINAKGEDFAPCKQFYRAYHSLCPNVPIIVSFIDIRRMGEPSDIVPGVKTLTFVVAQVSRFNEQREAGTFPTSLEP